MKTKLLLYFAILLCIEVAYGQEKRFEISYDISAWYENEEKPHPDIKETYFINNNIKIGYKINSFISFGLSSNYHYTKNYSKSAHLILSDGYIFQYYNSKMHEFGSGPYAKFSVGKNFKLSLLIEYNYAHIVQKSSSYEEHRDIRNSGKNNYTSQFFASQVSIGKKVFNNFTINLFIREKYTYDFKLQPKKSISMFTPFFKTYIGFGLTYNFNLKNNQK